MTIKLAINGFGRMGRLAMRVLQHSTTLQVALINDISCDAIGAAHLLKFDSIHGTSPSDIRGEGNRIFIDDQEITYTQHNRIEDLPLKDLGIEMVLECTGKFRTPESLYPYLNAGVKRVVLSAPVKGEGLNIVMGVNDHLYDPGKHRIVTAASCTTNCLAPVVKVIHENLKISHGSMTTIHDITNTQTVIDSGHKDLRRARACQLSLIPTTTGSAKAITTIFPELKGKLNGTAVRVPVLNASITDCVFEVETPTDVETVNRLLREASEGSLRGILGYEERPLVSIDYKSDPRSGVVDALSTMVINETQVKILAFYDNEMGYVHRMCELAHKVALSSEQ